MKKIYCFIVIALFCSATALYAQTASIDRSVIASVGSLNTSLDATGGEAVIPTYSSTTTILTQGFHQPIIVLPNGIDMVNVTNTQVKVYPNPASDNLWIELQQENAQAIDIVLTNVLGQQLQKYHEESVQVKRALDMHSYTPGYYNCTIYKEGALLKSFKVLKN